MWYTVRVMSGLSAHGDWREMRQNLEHLAPTTRATCLVHGDEDAATSMQGKLEEVGFSGVTVPVEGKRYPLTLA